VDGGGRRAGEGEGEDAGALGVGVEVEAEVELVISVVVVVVATSGKLISVALSLPFDSRGRIGITLVSTVVSKGI
jgi:hypothetical protein